MRFSLEKDSVDPILSAATEIRDDLFHNYFVFSESLSNWGKKIGSRLVFEIIEKTLSFISDDVNNEMKLYSDKFSNYQISFEGISKMYAVGEMAIRKSRSIQDYIIDILSVVDRIEVQNTCGDEVIYSHQLIGEYDELIQTFINDLYQTMEFHINKVQDMLESNYLCVSLLVYIEYKFSLIIAFAQQYHFIFTCFMEWFEETSKNNLSLLEDIEQRIRIQTEDEVEQLTEDILLQVIGNSVGYGSNSSLEKIFGTKTLENNDEGNRNHTQNDYEKKIDHTIKKSIKDFLDEFGDEEDIRDFRDYIKELEKVSKESKGPDGNLKKLSEFLTSNGKKYGGKILKSLAILIPGLLQKGDVLENLGKVLPDVFDVFSGKEVNDADKKADLGLELLKATGMSDEMPTDKEKLAEHLQQSTSEIPDKVQKILNSEKDNSSVGVSLSEANNDDSGNNDKQRHEVQNDISVNHKNNRVAEVSETVDTSYSLQYDANRDNSRKKKLDVNGLRCPKTVIDQDKIEDSTKNMQECINKLRTPQFEEALQNDIKQISEEVKNTNGKAKIDDRYKALSQYISGVKKGVIQDKLHDDRIRTDDIDEIVIDELLNHDDNLHPDDKLDNISRRLAGHPSQINGVIIVKDINELIPVLDQRCAMFQIEPDWLLKKIENAKIEYSNSSRVKRRSIIQILLDNDIILAGVLTISSILTFSINLPFGIFCAWNLLKIAFADDNKTAFTELLLELGEKRIEMLMEQFHVNGNVFTLI